MRIWDVPPERLCRNHLLGEHGELHGIWSIITQDKRGYAHHPDVLRWNGKLHALYLQHQEIVEEMERRGFNHNSPLDRDLATGSAEQDTHVDSPEEQLQMLREKGCPCRV